MIIYHDNGKESKKGFIYIASKDKLFYELALRSCESLRDFYPDANVTLFTHKQFIDKRSSIFDKVICEIPIHNRAKMWCMARTPYQRTLYNDVDTFICHSDIKKIHDHLNDCDMFFGGHLNYTVANRKWEYVDKKQNIPIKLHGSLCGYHKTDINLDFMQTWFDEYVTQIESEWEHNFAHPEWKDFDMFTLWRLTSKRYNEFDRFNGLNIKILDRRWNTTIQDLPADLNGPRVITQVDKDSYKKMPYIWSQISKELENERFVNKKYQTGESSIKYN